ncbi:ATP-binding protein [Actinoplanes sp. NEAU-A12]|uniref:ATP-binding protein n=1 Tax=Actinoplanes sandaracinus TaxID=3045177 RepID=A0ABT6WGU6_9ACTN|nr:ATP-binding protein [Actinoplanes sandaracinus]
MPLEHGTPASSTRRIAERALRRWGLTAHEDDVLLVTTELVQNVTKHTDDGGEFRMSVTDDAILIEVTDTNPAPPRVREIRQHRAGGRGMLLISSVARRWGSRPAVWAGRTGKIVWAELVRRWPR